MVAKEYECEIPQNPGPYDNKVNDNNNNNTKKKNISTAIKINLLNHISNRDTIKYACLNIEENIHKRIDIYNLSQKIS